jgi:hypothetical protein
MYVTQIKSLKEMNLGMRISHKRMISEMLIQRKVIWQRKVMIERRKRKETKLEKFYSRISVKQ